MRIVQINTTCGIGSTGKICVGISESLRAGGIENYILYSVNSSGYPLGIQCSDKKYIRMQAIKSRLLGNYGFNSGKSTRKMIDELEKIRPDIVHLHNIHGHDCNLEMLFEYLTHNHIKTVWTFHDCWAFTGYCTHFTMAKCDKWKTQCNHCVQKSEYSWFFDQSKSLYDKKKKLLEDLDLTIVTPSNWLAGLVGKSFLKDFPVQVIHNGINLSIFQPRKSSFRQKYGLENKKLVLGVSFDWGRKKGLDVFVSLAARLPDEYKIILIGISEATEKQLPKNILSLSRTQNQSELAEIYSTVDVFVNPTREDNYPTVNMEALACGTPVITFNTGGSPEMIDDTCGSVVDCDDVASLEKEIERVCGDNSISSHRCAQKALVFDENKRYEEYVRLYERIIASGVQGN